MTLSMLKMSMWSIHCLWTGWGIKSAPWSMSNMLNALSQWCNDTSIAGYFLVNPRRACAARVTVLGVSVFSNIHSCHKRYYVLRGGWRSEILCGFLWKFSVAKIELFAYRGEVRHYCPPVRFTRNPYACAFIRNYGCVFPRVYMCRAPRVPHFSAFHSQSSTSTQHSASLREMPLG